MWSSIFVSNTKGIAKKSNIIQLSLYCSAMSKLILTEEATLPTEPGFFVFMETMPLVGLSDKWIMNLFG